MRPDGLAALGASCTEPGGPVPTQFQPGRTTPSSFRAGDQLSPSESETVRNTSLLLRVCGRRMRPVPRSCTGAALPIVSKGAERTIDAADQLTPALVLRLTMSSVGAPSLQLPSRASASASSVPRCVWRSTGILMQAYGLGTEGGPSPVAKTTLVVSLPSAQLAKCGRAVACFAHPTGWVGSPPARGAGSDAVHQRCAGSAMSFTVSAPSQRQLTRPTGRCQSMKLGSGALASTRRDSLRVPSGQSSTPRAPEPQSHHAKAPWTRVGLRGPAAALSEAAAAQMMPSATIMARGARQQGPLA